MNMRLIICVGLLGTLMPMSVNALPSSNSGRLSAHSSGAELLKSEPELMRCDLETSQALWHPSNPIALGEIPCQYLGSVGGPLDTSEGETYFFPTTLDSLHFSDQLDRQRTGLTEIPQTDQFAPKRTYFDFRDLVRLVPNLFDSLD